MESSVGNGTRLPGLTVRLLPTGNIFLGKLLHLAMAQTAHFKEVEIVPNPQNDYEE